MDTKRLEQLELQVMASGGWGTIGAYSLSAGEKLAAHVGGTYGLMCHSMDAAYEAVIRACGAAKGKKIITGAVSSPMHALIAVCTGAKPLFAKVCDTCGMILPSQLESLLAQNGDVCCVALDYLAEKDASAYPLEKVAAICKQYGVPLIINAGGVLSARHNGKPLTCYGDSVLYSLEEGSEIYAGKGGLAVTDSMEMHKGSFAYHNCGRGFNEGASITMDAIVGGDLRVTEWTAAAAQTVLESGEFAQARPRKLAKMEGQPVFETDYAKKMTD